MQLYHLHAIFSHFYCICHQRFLFFLRPPAPVNVGHRQSIRDNGISVFNSSGVTFVDNTFVFLEIYTAYLSLYN